jgi:hypothetical protein
VDVSNLLLALAWMLQCSGPSDQLQQDQLHHITSSTPDTPVLGFTCSLPLLIRGLTASFSWQGSIMDTEALAALMTPTWMPEG